MALFKHRQDAGKKLAACLKRCNLDDALIVALPRGGVPAAYFVAKAYGLPMYTQNTWKCAF